MAETVTLEECENGLAVITIDRPKALNAASVKMVSELREAIAKVKASGTVKAVLLQGAGEKGFCSGGDVKALHAPLVAGGTGGIDATKEQMFQEYTAIFELKQLSVPTVALLHGITMGFGLGLGGVVRYGVATEKSRFAMPENNIGFFPDAGFAHLAANAMPKGLGRLMALTGCHLIGAGDVLAAKLATHSVTVEKLPALVEALKVADLADADAAVKTCLEGVVSEAPAPKLLVDGGGALPSKFAAAESLPDVYTMLETEAEAGGWAAELLPTMRKGAPFSQAIVLQLMKSAEAEASAGPGSLATALERDFAVACRMASRADLAEGLRAVLVDKDNNAKWQPSTVAEVSAEEVVASLAALPEGERTLGVTA